MVETLKVKALVFRPHVLKLARVSQSLSLYDVAMRINTTIQDTTNTRGKISSATISGWENGESDPASKSLGLWASALDVDIKDCFDIVETGEYRFVSKGGRPRG